MKSAETHGGAHLAQLIGAHTHEVRVMFINAVLASAALVAVAVCVLGTISIV